MKYAYEPFILKRFAEGRLFHVNPNMPFEFFLDCFRFEQPFFMIAQLDDGRIAITPNAMCIPLNLVQAGYWPQGLFPSQIEYVTMKQGLYPVIMTAHAVQDFNEWVMQFEKSVLGFPKQTLKEFISTTFEVLPLRESKEKYPTRETVEI